MILQQNHVCICSFTLEHMGMCGIRHQINSLAPGGYDYSLKLENFKLISTMNILCIFSEIAIRWMPQHLTDHYSTLVQGMAWCRQATSHYLSQCWPRSLSPYDVTRPQWVKSTWIYLAESTSCPSNFREFGIKMKLFAFKKINLQMLSANCPPFCLSLIVLTWSPRGGWLQPTTTIPYIKWSQSPGQPASTADEIKSDPLSAIPRRPTPPIPTRRSENDNTPQPLDQWTYSPFIGQQVGNWSICHALWPMRKPIVHPTLYPTHISCIPSQSNFPFLKYGF